MPSILVADDDPAFLSTMSGVLAAAGYAVVEAATTAEAKSRFPRAQPDVVLVDLAMPGDGLQLVRELASATATPIIVISGFRDERAKVVALDAGADDYITKPFSAGELLARIRAVTRRRSGTKDSEQAIVAGRLHLDAPGRTATYAGTAVDVTPIEFELLRVLAEADSQWLPTRTVLQAVWGPGYEREAGYVRVYVRRLRRKFEAAVGEPLIESQPRLGYRLPTT